MNGQTENLNIYDKRALKAIERFEKDFKYGIGKTTSKEVCIECLNKLRLSYLTYLILDDKTVAQKGLSAFEEAYGLARNRAISLGGDVSKYPETLEGMVK